MGNSFKILAYVLSLEINSSLKLDFGVEKMQAILLEKCVYLGSFLKHIPAIGMLKPR